MKKKIILCVALAAFSFGAFGFMDWNDSKTDPVETSVNGGLASITPVTGKIDKRIFSDLTYDVGPSQFEKNRPNPYLVIVPEKQAEYEGGKDGLMEYLKENSKEARASIQMDKLQPFKLIFTVTKKGTIENVKLDGTSGYLAIDNTMIELITKAPGKWKPAENSKGEKEDQELVVSFGLTGC